MMCGWLFRDFSVLGPGKSFIILFFTYGVLWAKFYYETSIFTGSTLNAFHAGEICTVEDLVDRRSQLPRVVSKIKFVCVNTCFWTLCVFVCVCQRAKNNTKKHKKKIILVFQENDEGSF